MVVVYAGAGMFLILFFLAALVLGNLEIFLHYTGARFAEINWWLPCALSVVPSWLLADSADRMNREASAETYMGRVFLYLGRQHHIFWIPLRWWAFLFLGIAVWQLTR